MIIVNHHIRRNLPIRFINLGFLNPLGDFLGGAASAAASVASTKMQIESNERMQREAQGFTKSEREAQQLYQTGEREAQNQWQEQQYLNYNSPQALAAQYAAAGLNPKLAMEGGAQGLQASSGSSGSAPSGQVVHPPYMNVTSPTQGFEQLAGAFSSLAQAKKLGVDANLVKDMADDLIRKNKLDADAAEFVKIIKFNEAKAAPTKVQQVVQDLLNSVKNGEKIDNEIFWLKQKGAISEHEAETWLHTWSMRLNAEIGVQNSQALLNKSLAGLNDILKAESIDRAGYYRAMTGVQSVTKKLMDLEYNIQSASNEEEVENLKYQRQKFRQKFDQELELVFQQAELARKNNDWFTYNQIYKSLEGIVQGLGYGAGTALLEYLEAKGGRGPKGDLKPININNNIKLPNGNPGYIMYK